MSEVQGNHILVTISRQLGSGGSYVGRQLSKRLGFRYVDREVLGKAAEYLDAEEESLVFREERVSNWLENLLRGFIYGTPEAAYVPPPVRPIYDAELFRTEAEIIRKIADRYNAIIVGRGGFHVLRDRPGLVKVFLHAPMDFRICRVMDVYRLSDPDEAAALIRDSDAARKRFADTVAGADWTDSLSHHLCIDTARSGLAAAEEIVVDFVDAVRERLES